jgi:hypothetical protein
VTSESRRDIYPLTGSAFNAEFAGEEAPDSRMEEPQMGKPARPGGRKRTGTTSVNKEASASKRPKNQTCAACDIKGLPDGWTTFERNRPEGFVPNPKRTQKVQDKLVKDKKLAAEVERINLQEGTVDEA